MVKVLTRVPSLPGYSIDGFTDPKGPSSTRFSYNFFMANPMIAKLESLRSDALMNKICFAQWHDAASLAATN